MATFQEMCQSVIEFHEKLNYAESTSIRGRVLKSVNKAIKHVWSKMDWSFKYKSVSQFEYDPSGASNVLPVDFLSFNGAGTVVLLRSDSITPERELDYMPFGEIMACINGPNPQYGNPEVYSIGAPLEGGGTQRAIYLYPIPRAVSYMNFVYQTSAPQSTLEDWTDEITGIPETWHDTVEEVAILLRMVDKSADVTTQAALVKTSLEAMARDEPHGRENAIKMVPAYAWRMNIRY
jgi:hypothetical protein